MKLQTITDITEDQVLNTIKKLEANGFYLQLVGYGGRAARKREKSRPRVRRCSPMTEERVALKQAYERRKQGTLKGKWRHMRRTMRKRDVGSWDFPFEEWQLLWRKAGTIGLGDGSTMLAWQARGRDKEGGWGAEPQRPQLRRWDITKPYRLDNVYVAYKKGVLADGELIAEELLKDIP